MGIYTNTANLSVLLPGAFCDLCGRDFKSGDVPEELHIKKSLEQTFYGNGALTAHATAYTTVPAESTEDFVRRLRDAGYVFTMFYGYKMLICPSCQRRDAKRNLNAFRNDR
jgi:hypothetical protein